jgi:hypothetical protein
LQRKIIRQPAEVNHRAVSDADGPRSESDQSHIEFRLQHGVLDNDDSATKLRHLVCKSLRRIALAHVDLWKAQQGAHRRPIETAPGCDQDDANHARVPVRRKTKALSP